MNLETTLLNIERRVSAAEKPAVMSSFGKDSMVLMFLCRMLKLDLPVIYHRNPWFPEKNSFADHITQEWDLDVHDWHPFQVGVKTHDDCIQPVARYLHGTISAIGIPIGILEPSENEPYLCGLVDIIGREKGDNTFRTDLLLWGQKTCDVDIFEGPSPLKTDFYQPEVENAPALFYPMHDWTDDDVWTFIIQHKVPYQTERYDIARRKERYSKRYNNDWVPACMKCIDRRQPAMVFCPKLLKSIPNVSHKIADLEVQPPHIEYAT